MPKSQFGTAQRACTFELGHSLDIGHWALGIKAMIRLEHYLIVSAVLFSLGLLGVIVRRNLLIIYMSLELMLNAANLALVAFSRFNNNLNGQVMVFFIITVAAAEVAVGLALIVALYRKRQTAHVEDLTLMKN